MQIAKNKTAAITIAILLMTTIGSSMILIPSASAHTPPWIITTHAYIVVAPNPIGVGQRATVYMWLDTVFGAGFETPSYAQLTNNYRFHNYNLTVIKPDGTTDTTIYPTISDPTSSQYTYYTPDQAGNYTFIFNFPGQPYNDSVAGDYNPTSVLVGDSYSASSATTTLTVQQTAIPGPTGSSPLPTAFWMRPIYGNNNDWYTISSNWLGTGSPVNSATGSGYLSGYNSQSFFQVYPGDAVGPTTSHVMWTDPLEAGGVVGGLNEPKLGDTYNEGSAYLQKFTNVIILDGDIFYRQPIGGLAPSSGPEVCQSLITGQIIWSNPTMPTISFGYLYDHQDPNQHGVQSGILFTGFGAPVSFFGLTFPGGVGEAFDAATGDWLFNVTNSPGGAPALGPSGEQLVYTFANDGTPSNPQWDLREWNSSKLWNYIGIGASDILTPTLYNASSTDVPSTSTTTTTGVVTTSTTGLVSIPTVNPTLTGAYTPYSNTYIVNGGIDNANSPFDRFDWNISAPYLNTMGNQTLTTLANGTVVEGSNQTVNPFTGRISYVNPDASNPITVLAAFYDNMLICRNGSYSSGTPQTFATYSVNPYTYFAIDINTTHSTFGQILWTNTVQPAPGNLTVTFAGADPTVGTFAESYQQTMQFIGYSMQTGKQIWGPTAEQAPFDYYGNPIFPFISSVPAYGMLYSSSYAGIVYANSMVNGSLLWTYGNGGPGNSTFAGFNTPYGDYPTQIQAIGNGVIYTATGEHTVDSPIYKGCLARAINATTGQEIWTLSNDNNEFAAMSYAIADGYAVMWNGYDNSIYTVGRGPSAITVTASPNVSTFGDNVVIQGTVMDISAGTKQTQVAADFPNGVPVASDASMESLMAYVYQQQPHPANFTGVSVSLYVLDSNGNYRQIGTATTDITGSYSFTWKPDIPGDFKVYASFDGTNGYWPSSSETAFNIMEAPTPTNAAASAPTSVADQYLLPLGIGIIVLIIIVGALLAALILRKR